MLLKRLSLLMPVKFPKVAGTEPESPGRGIAAQRQKLALPWVAPLGGALP
jgi:hypothetical protein